MLYQNFIIRKSVFGRTRITHIHTTYLNFVHSNDIISWLMFRIIFP